MTKAAANEITTSLSSFDAAWFSTVLGERVATVEWSDPSALGYVSAIKKVRLTKKSGGEPLNLVVKMLLAEEGSLVDRKTIVDLGCAREADFYNAIDRMSPDRRIAFRDILPRVYHAESDWVTGQKIILMEDLSREGIVSGWYFGPGSPLNWGKDLASLTSACPDVCPVEIAKETFVRNARMHAAFWNRVDDDFAEFSWLRGKQWIRKEGKNEWETAMRGAVDAFEKMERRMNEGTLEYRVPEGLWACLRTSFGKVSWENFLRDLETDSWTLVHGDCHPGNIAWMYDDPRCKVRFFDWEMVGLAPGPQELGQYVISHLDTTRYGSVIHRELVRAYYDELIAVDPRIGKDFNFESCWEGFVYGGLRKWLWMLPQMAVWNPEAIPYFVDQMDNFRKDHGVVADKVGLPRF